jgi:hypothetical protein
MTCNQQLSDSVKEKLIVNTSFCTLIIQPNEVGSEEKGKEGLPFILSLLPFASPIS